MIFLTIMKEIKKYRITKVNFILLTLLKKLLLSIITILTILKTKGFKVSYIDKSENRQQKYFYMIMNKICHLCLDSKKKAVTFRFIQKALIFFFSN